MTAKPTTDPVLGDLQSGPAEAPGTFAWVGTSPFLPTGLPITYQFQAPKAGPTDGHRATAGELQAKYHELLPQILPVLVQAVIDEGEDPKAIPSARLVEVWLPEAIDAATEWDLTYEIGPDELQYMVDMRGWTPVGAMVC